MASTRRSVWEIRFKALMQELRFRRDSIHHNASVAALSDGGLPEHRKKILNAELEIINLMLKRGGEFETMHPSRIFIVRE